MRQPCVVMNRESAMLDEVDELYAAEEQSKTSLVIANSTANFHKLNG
jgi:hypothetical protein